MKLKRIIRWLALACMAVTLCGCTRLEDFYGPGSERGRIYRKYEPYPHAAEGYGYWPNPDSWRATQIAYDTATLPELAAGWALLSGLALAFAAVGE